MLPSRMNALLTSVISNSPRRWNQAPDLLKHGFVVHVDAVHAQLDFRLLGFSSIPRSVSTNLADPEAFASGTSSAEFSAPSCCGSVYRDGCPLDNVVANTRRACAAAKCSAAPKRRRYLLLLVRVVDVVRPKCLPFASKRRIAGVFAAVTIRMSECRIHRVWIG